MKHTPEKRDRVPVTANLVEKLKNKRMTHKSAGAAGAMSRTANTSQINQEKALNSLMNYQSNTYASSGNDKRL